MLWPNAPFRATNRRSFLVTTSLAAAAVWTARADDVIRASVKLPKIIIKKKI